MKSKILSIAAVVSLGLVMTAQAGDIEGSWIAKIWDSLLIDETVFSFTVDGTKLTGSVTDRQGKAAIQEGKIDGDEISFFVIRKSAGKETKLVYYGKAAENEIELSWIMQGTGMRPQRLVVKREFLRDNDYIQRPKATPIQPPRR